MRATLGYARRRPQLTAHAHAQEMTLEQYEKVQAEKKKALLAALAPAVTSARDVASEFASKKPMGKKDDTSLLAALSLKPKEVVAAKPVAGKEAKKAPVSVAVETGFKVVSEESQRNNDSGFGGRGGGRGAGRDGGRGGRDGGRGGRSSGGRDGGRGGYGAARGASSTPHRSSGGPSFHIEEAAFPSLGK